LEVDLAFLTEHFTGKSVLEIFTADGLHDDDALAGLHRELLTEHVVDRLEEILELLMNTVVDLMF
jgi:hypothetical protein